MIPDREHLELTVDERPKPYRLVANSKRRGCLGWLVRLVRGWRR